MRGVKTLSELNSLAFKELGFGPLSYFCANSG